VNRVFLSGRLKKKPEIVYTPRGERLMLFPLWVDDGAFSIDVVCMDDMGKRSMADMEGSNVIVSGVLTKNPGKQQETLRLKANKILWMEDLDA
jgi:hypothetical protein